VLPPDASAWRDGDVAVGQRVVAVPVFGRESQRHARRTRRRLWTRCRRPAAGFASARIALRSFSGSFHDTGCGTAPSFQIAKHASTNSGPFGSAIRDEVSLRDAALGVGAREPRGGAVELPNGERAVAAHERGWRPGVAVACQMRAPG